MNMITQNRLLKTGVNAICAMMLLGIIIFMTAGCGGTADGYETDKGVKNWPLEGGSVSESWMIENVEVGDKIEVEIKLNEGNVHAVIKNPSGTSLYDNTVSEERTIITAVEAGKLELSWDTTDAVGKITMWKK